MCLYEFAVRSLENFDTTITEKFFIFLQNLCVDFSHGKLRNAPETANIIITHQMNASMTYGLCYEIKHTSMYSLEWLSQFVGSAEFQPQKVVNFVKKNIRTFFIGGNCMSDIVWVSYDARVLRRWVGGVTVASVAKSQANV